MAVKAVLIIGAGRWWTIEPIGPGVQLRTGLGAPLVRRWRCGGKGWRQRLSATPGKNLPARRQFMNAVPPPQQVLSQAVAGLCRAPVP